MYEYTSSGSEDRLTLRQYNLFHPNGLPPHSASEFHSATQRDEPYDYRHVGETSDIELVNSGEIPEEEAFPDRPSGLMFHILSRRSKSS